MRRGSLLWHFWTLAVEEQFYFVWPGIVWLVGARGTRWIAIAGAIVLIPVRLLWFHAGGAFATIACGPSHGDGLLVGALCAIFYRDGTALKFSRNVLPAVAISAIGGFVIGAVSLRSDTAYAGFCIGAGYTLLAVGFGALVLITAISNGGGDSLQKFLCNRPLTRVGMYSYGIYVLHPFFLLLDGAFLNALPSPSSGEWVAMTGGAWIATFIFAWLIFELFERQFLELKRYFEYRVTEAKLLPVAVPMD